MSLTGDPPTIGAWKAQVVESAAAINRLRWDLKIAGSNWTVIFDSSTAYSKGEKKYLGTEFAQELEQSMKYLLIAGSAAALLASGYAMAQDATLTIEPAHRTIIKQYVVKEHIRPIKIRESVAIGTVLPVESL